MLQGFDPRPIRIIGKTPLDFSGVRIVGPNWKSMAVGGLTPLGTFENPAINT